MKYRVVSIVAAVGGLLLSAASPAAADGLHPGRTDIARLPVPVNVVLVGFGRDVNARALLGQLATTSHPIVRQPAFYGLKGREIGLDYRLRYRIVRPGAGYERSFFAALRRLGRSAPRTQFQTLYDQQKSNVLDIPRRVLDIDAPSVERWLDGHARGLGIGAHGYTVYLVDWYGHPGFRFHVYTRRGRTDPDTGFDFSTRDSRAMIAWGGDGRSWFYDLSAGPESWSSNWNVDNADVDGDGVPDYRIPPAWEYRAGGYRSPALLSADLGRLVRYVAVDLLFLSSPLYDPLNTTPGVGGAKVVDVNMFEDDPGASGLRWVRPRFALAMWRSFEPYYRWRVAIHDRRLDPGALHAFRVWATLVQDQNACWRTFGDPFAELFCYFDSHLRRYVPAYPANDYVGAVFAFNTTDAKMGSNVGLLGYSDDDWRTGTQSHVFMFDTPQDRALGFGFTDTLTHEFGHHIGMSHPHDGYDSARGIDFGAAGAFYYTWVGDESDTVMHYLGLSGHFDRFDRDNMYRWETAGYINRANDLLGRILASGRAGRVRAAIARANRLAAAARRGLAGWRYLSSVTDAYASYNALRVAAGRIGVVTTVATPALQAALAPQAVPHQVDPIR